MSKHILFEFKKKVRLHYGKTKFITFKKEKLYLLSNNKTGDVLQKIYYDVLRSISGLITLWNLDIQVIQRQTGFNRNAVGYTTL